MSDPLPPAELARRVAEFQRRLAWLDRSFRQARELEAATGTFNESLRNLAKALNPRARRKETRTRLHPYLEVAIKSRWLKRQRASGTNAPGRPPNPSEIFEICEKLKAEIKPTRGRPAGTILTYHVQALMALVQQTCGEPALAMRFKDSVYDPQMSSAGGRIVEMFFRRIDPSITTTQLANIIAQAHASGSIKGKRFQDFFPFYGGHIDVETGRPIPGPGYRLVSFEPTHPIYCY